MATKAAEYKPTSRLFGEGGSGRLHSPFRRWSSWTRTRSAPRAPAGVGSCCRFEKFRPFMLAAAKVDRAGPAPERPVAAVEIDPVHGVAARRERGTQIFEKSGRHPDAGHDGLILRSGGVGNAELAAGH